MINLPTFLYAQQPHLSPFAQFGASIRNTKVLLGLQIVALWPMWRWYSARSQDSSDEPLGPLALIIALMMLSSKRDELKTVPRVFPLWIVCFFNILLLFFPEWPPLLKALVGVLSITTIVAASLERPHNAFPIGMLLILSLPLVASLQFYGGYPLRRLATEGASVLLQWFGWPIFAEGTGLRWGERLMLVDAPCSGVHMLWVGLVMAATASSLSNASPVRVLFHTFLAMVLVLLGNILRSAVLFFKETGIVSLPDWTHEGIGIALFMIVLIPLAWVTMKTVPVLNRTCTHTLLEKGISPVYYLVVLAFFLTGSMGFLTHEPVPFTALYQDPVWPSHFRGRELIRLPLFPEEIRWMREFPGQAARFTDGESELFIRRVAQPTRQLHPAMDCFKGVGYTVTTPKILLQNGEYWQCFIAKKEASSQEVCERLYDEDGNTWTDTSSWYWSATLNRSKGPWWSITVAKPVEVLSFEF